MGHEGMQTSCNRRRRPPCPGVSLRQSIASCRVRLRVRRRPLIRETWEGASAFSDEIPAHVPQEDPSHVQPHIKDALARRRQAPPAVPPAYRAFSRLVGSIYEDSLRAILRLPVEGIDAGSSGLSDEDNPFRPEGMVYSDSRSAPGAPPLNAPDPAGGNPLG